MNYANEAAWNIFNILPVDTVNYQPLLFHYYPPFSVL